MLRHTPVAVIDKELLDLCRAAGSTMASELQYDHQLCFAQLLGALKGLLGIPLGCWFHLLLLFCHGCSFVGTAELIRLQLFTFGCGTLRANLKIFLDWGPCPVVSMSCGVQLRLLLKQIVVGGNGGG